MNMSYLKKRMFVSFIKMLVTTVVVFGFIWLFTGWLEDFLDPTFVFVINIGLNIIAVIGLTYHGKITGARESRESLNKFNCEFILDPFEMILDMYKLEMLQDKKIDLLNHSLGFIADRVDIVRKNTGYKNNIDFFYLIKKANELNPTSDSFLQDIEDFKQLVKKEFNHS